MPTLTPTTLFTPEKVAGGSAKAFWTTTKIGLVIAVVGAIVEVNTRRYPQPFFYLLREALFGVMPSIWFIWVGLWAFGGRSIWAMGAAKKFLKKMEPEWEDGFKKHTGVSDRVSVSGYFEDGKSQVDGIAYKDRVVHLMTRGKVYSVPYSQVRTWEWKIRTPETVEVHGAGMQATAAQASANDSNINAAVRAFMQSGFFIQIADENNPVLQFHSSDEAVLRRWQEIFNQIDEGKI
jgi:hypothetical protein